MTVGDYSGGDCGKLEWGFCCGGWFLIVGTIALVGAVVSFVEYKSLKNAEMTECFYVDSIKEDCTITSGQSSSTCTGSKDTYYYDVLPHSEVDETNIECSNDTGHDWNVFLEGICICSMNKITKQPYPKYDDNQWHICYVADCDGNDWSFDSPATHKKFTRTHLFFVEYFFFSHFARVVWGFILINE
eukprot:UN13412